LTGKFNIFAPEGNQIHSQIRCDNAILLNMKILMLLDSQFPPDIRVEKEANSLLKEGNEVSILCYNFGGENTDEIINGIRIFRFWIPNQVAKKILGFSLQLPIYRLIWQRAISRTYKQYNFEAVHIHDLPLCTLNKFIKRKFVVPVIADMHENYPYLVAEQPYMNSLFSRIFLSKRKWFKKEKEWLAQADSIICVAEEMKQRVESVLINSQPIVVVPNTPAIDELSASMANLPRITTRFSGTFNVLYVGGIDPTRGIDILIHSAKWAIKTIPLLKIVIVGDGKILSDMKHLVSTLQLEKTVFFAGKRPQEEIGSYISISDICVIPHRRSPQTDNSSPNKLFQYLYFKKPVIASNCNSVEKLIHSENCGLIYHDSSPEELAARMTFLFENPTIRIEMGYSGYSSVMDKYNWDSTVEPLISIYSDLKL
jgi:glycosyltransferase involved in cell wall biosynthesis